MSTSPAPTCEWRCCACGTLLGVANGGALEVRYKTAGYTIRGAVGTRCRRCGASNHFETADTTTNHNPGKACAR